MRYIAKLFLLTWCLSSVADEGTNVIMRVNDCTLTLGEYSQYVDMIVDLYEFRNPKAKTDRSAEIRQKTQKSAEVEFIRRLALRSKFSKYALTNDIEGVRSRVERRYVRTFCPKKKKFPDLLVRAEQKGYKGLLLRLMEDDIRFEAIIGTVYSNEINCTEADYKAAHDRVNAFNASATATNALIRAQAMDVLRRAWAGEDFAALADKYSMDEQGLPGGDLGEMTEEEFLDNPSVWQVLNAMKPGEISDLLAIAEGDAIYKLVKRLKPDESNSQTAALQVSRIFFRRAYVFPEESEESFRRSIDKEKREAFLKEFNRKLLKGIKIWYPCGKNVFR